MDCKGGQRVKCTANKENTNWGVLQFFTTVQEPKYLKLNLLTSCSVNHKPYILNANKGNMGKKRAEEVWCDKTSQKWTVEGWAINHKLDLIPIWPAAIFKLQKLQFFKSEICQNTSLIQFFCRRDFLLYTLFIHKSVFYRIVY